MHYFSGLADGYKKFIVKGLKYLAETQILNQSYIYSVQVVAYIRKTERNIAQTKTRPVRIRIALSGHKWLAMRRASARKGQESKAGTLGRCLTCDGPLSSANFGESMHLKKWAKREVARGWTTKRRGSIKERRMSL